MLDGLVDDAGLFPPASLPMIDALRAHLENRSGRYAALLGRFLCSASRLRELVTAMDDLVSPDDDIALGLIIDNGADSIPEALAVLEAEPRLVLSVVEMPVSRAVPDLAAAARFAVEALPDVEGYVELPRQPGWESALAVLADSSYGAKLRTGGTAAETFPTEAEVAAFIQACVTAEVPFKCTAGLHPAVRHTDPVTGFEHHGFVNVLLATAAATEGVGLPAVEHALTERDPMVVAGRFTELDPGAAAVTRSFFTAFGSCSFNEPVDDLRAMGLLVGA
jgi:hypothetical protein